MKNVILNTFFFTSLTLSALACEFHLNDNSSRYAWSGINFNHSPINDANSFNNGDEVNRPDFRYTRPRPTAKSKDQTDTKNDADKINLNETGKLL